VEWPATRRGFGADSDFPTEPIKIITPADNGKPAPAAGRGRGRGRDAGAQHDKAVKPPSGEGIPGSQAAAAGPAAVPGVKKPRARRFGAKTPETEQTGAKILSVKVAGDKGSDVKAPGDKNAAVNSGARTAAAQPAPTAVAAKTAAQVPDADPGPTAAPAKPAVATAVIQPRPAEPESRKAPRRRRLTLLVVAAAIIVGGSAGFMLTRQSPSTNAVSPAVILRDHAAAWVAAQVGSSADVSCDPVMCQALQTHGILPGNLDELRPGTPDPLASDVVVATAAVRSDFGSRLTSVYAPDVIASFGSGSGRIDVRVIAPRGAAAYESELKSDVALRKSSAAELMTNSKITASAAARRQMLAGQVDARLLVTITALAARHPIYLMSFNDSGPGASPAEPLRCVYLAGTRAVPHGIQPSYLHGLTAWLNAEPPPFRAAKAAVKKLPGGQFVLRIQYSAPSPLELLAIPPS
jgi:hypothetical protein